jgi:hypothetical protein
MLKQMIHELNTALPVFHSFHFGFAPPPSCYQYTAKGHFEGKRDARVPISWSEDLTSGRTLDDALHDKGYAAPGSKQK